MDDLLVAPRGNSLEIQLEPAPSADGFEWVHGDASHFCGALVERCRTLDNLICPLCNYVFHINGKPRDLLFQHLQEVHFSYDYGCVYKCSSCKLQFATSRNASGHLTTYPKHTLKCSLCKTSLEKSKVRSHFAGEHYREFCTALAEELGAAGSDDMLNHVKAYASVRRNNRLTSAAPSAASGAGKSRRLICGQICEFESSEEDCCSVHEKYKKIYKRYCRNDFFRCPMCLKGSSDLPALAIGHLILEHSLQLLSHRYTCAMCDESFGDVFDAANHVKQGHVLYCGMCSSHLQDVPSVREHLNRQHCGLIMEVTDRVLGINPKRSVISELTSICYRDGRLKCITCSQQVAANAEVYENHIILSHLDFPPVRCQWCQLPFAYADSKRHGARCGKLPKNEVPYFICNVADCKARIDSTAEHYQQAHWSLIKPNIMAMIDCARRLYPEWAATLADYRERISSLQIMLSTVSPTIVDEHCCQQNWTKPQSLFEHILSDHVALDEPWFLFKVSADPCQRLTCSLCEKPVFEMTWVYHVIECHGLIARDAIDKRMLEIQYLCGFKFSITPMIDLPIIKVEIEEEVKSSEHSDTQPTAGPSFMLAPSDVDCAPDDDAPDIKSAVFNFVGVAQDVADETSGRKPSDVLGGRKQKRKRCTKKEHAQAEAEHTARRTRLQRKVYLSRIDNLKTS